MKLLILFFVADCMVSAEDKAAAKTIEKAVDDSKVVFRNGAVAAREKPEKCDGVVGKVPANYADFPQYDLSGNKISDGSKTAGTAPVGFNTLGLPEGHPADRDALKAALTEAGVEYHASAATKALVVLYRTHFELPDPADGDTNTED